MEKAATEFWGGSAAGKAFPLLLQLAADLEHPPQGEPAGGGPVGSLICHMSLNLASGWQIFQDWEPSRATRKFASKCSRAGYCYAKLARDNFQSEARGLEVKASPFSPRTRQVRCWAESYTDGDTYDSYLLVCLASLPQLEWQLVVWALSSLCPALGIVASTQ